MAQIETPKFDITQFIPQGPVCAAYIQSEGPIDSIRGPWGSGKTVGTVFKLTRHAGNLFPICKERGIQPLTGRCAKRSMTQI